MISATLGSGRDNAHGVPKMLLRMITAISDLALNLNIRAKSILECRHVTGIWMGDRTFIHVVAQSTILPLNVLNVIS